MKVFGLQAPVYRLARVASRLSAETSSIAAERRDALARFERARGLVQLDTVFVNLAPGRDIKHFTAYDPVAKWTVNGAVERCNGAWRYEFYDTYDLPGSVEALNPILDGFQHLYNHHRPHGALAGQTPAAYLAKRQAAASHMC